MIYLSDKKCVACEGGVPPLDVVAIRALQNQLHADWRVSDDTKSISRDFKFKDFKEAMVFVKAIAELAESEGHHPDIHLFYNKLRLELSTHAIGGLSENDFILAAKIDKIVL